MSSPGLSLQSVDLSEPRFVSLSVCTGSRGVEGTHLSKAALAILATGLVVPGTPPVLPHHPQPQQPRLLAPESSSTWLITWSWKNTDSPLETLNADRLFTALVLVSFTVDPRGTQIASSKLVKGKI